jgi:hypothetical protein
MKFATPTTKSASPCTVPAIASVVSIFGRMLSSVLKNVFAKSSITLIELSATLTAALELAIAKFIDSSVICFEFSKFICLNSLFDLQIVL